ncbi:MAG: choice-of-anchor D domain-containing protein [Candidatus Zhuqueibacterota bacterium]
MSYYKIYRSQTNNFVPSSGDSLAVVFKPDTTYRDTDVINGQTYYYRISAVDSAGNESEFSDQASATPQAGPADSDIYLPVTHYDFGNVLVDSSKTWLLTVKNLGLGRLEIYTVQNSVSAFSVNPKTASIAELDSFHFTLTFSPATEKTFQDTFRISSNDPDEATILFPVTGRGVIAPQPSIFISEISHNFGDVPVHSSSSWQLTIENKGTADLLVQNISSSNPVFSADPQQFTLRPSGRQEVQVQFAPDSLLSESGVLTILSNDPENPEKTVALSGAGSDSESPQITVQPFTTTMQVNTAFTISAHITDNWNVASAALFYRRGSESGFQRIEMSEGTGQVYSAALPASAITFLGLACFIRAEDSAGNVSATDTLSWPIRFSDGALTTGLDGSPYASGYPRGEWRMISAPANLDEKTVAAILLDETALGSYGEPNWRLFSFKDTDGDGANDGYAEYQASLESSVFSFSAGKAFWLKANPEGGAIHIDAGPGQVLPLETKSITLSPGWNQVGNPFAFPISFSPADENIVDQLYAPDGTGGYELTTVLLPWAGYFVFVNGASAVELSFDPENARPLNKMAESGNGWRLRIVAECGGSRDRINSLGVSEAGSDAWDKRDYPEPPVPGNYVSLYFPHADWPGRCKAYTSDIRQYLGQGQIWDVRVKSNEGAGAVRLNWAMDQPPETDLEILLYDKNRNKTIDMNSNDAYSFQRFSENEEAVFQVFAGSPGFMEKQVQGLRAQFPQEFGLSQNYPNPFNATTRIEFKIPSLQRVSLKIYDLLGREVKSLLDDVRPAGYYHLEWNGRNNAGADVSSGIYVCLVRAGERAETRKVILMK